MTFTFFELLRTFSRTLGKAMASVCPSVCLFVCLSVSPLNRPTSELELFSIQNHGRSSPLTESRGHGLKSKVMVRVRVDY